jgi:hypothetical protein
VENVDEEEIKKGTKKTNKKATMIIKFPYQNGQKYYVRAEYEIAALAAKVNKQSTELRSNRKRNVAVYGEEL